MNKFLPNWVTQSLGEGQAKREVGMGGSLSNLPRTKFY